MLKANWIEPPYDFGEITPIYLKNFTTKGDIVSATMRITARGVYEAALNGKRVGDYIMPPGWTVYRERIQVQQYDVTALIKSDNVLTVHASSGWFRKFGLTPDYIQPPTAIIAEITITYRDGSCETIATDESWLVAESSLKYCDLYNGIMFDATEAPDFTENAVVSSDNSQQKLVTQQGPEVIEYERLKPKAIFTAPNGETVIDFGQNMAGYLEFTVDAKRGDKVSFSFGEILDKDGNFYNVNYRSAKALYEYTCRDGVQSYKPNLTFYGFRYVRINQFPTTPKAEDFTAIVIHSKMERTGKIECSDSEINQLFSNIIWGQKGNFIDLPTDCPQRDERLGWTGDAHIFARTATYNFDCLDFFKKWLRDLRLEQAPSGAVPEIVPALFYGKSSPVWADAVTGVPWQLYLTYGDTEILAEMFEPMKKWVDFCVSEEGMSRSGFYADWLELSAPEGQHTGDTRQMLIRDAFHAYSAQIICKVGTILGEDVSRYEELYENFVKYFKETYKDEFLTQTEYILALYLNLTDKPEEIAGALAERIHADGDKIQTGFVGTPYILHALSRYGYNDLAYTLLLRREFPSWLYPISKGATTMWEHWDGIRPDGSLWPGSMNSYNHYAYGAVADWMYGVAAGINTVESHPGFERVHFEPVPTDQLNWFSAEIKTKYGIIKSKWRHENGKTVYEITTPVPATAKIEGKIYELQTGSYTF